MQFNLDWVSLVHLAHIASPVKMLEEVQYIEPHHTHVKELFRYFKIISSSLQIVVNLSTCHCSTQPDNIIVIHQLIKPEVD